MRRFSLEDRVALVTGSRRGIGRSVALAMAEVGADVVVCDAVADGELEGVSREIEAMGRRSAYYRVDVSKKSEVDAMVRGVMESFDRIDVLVNCAGVWTPGQSLLDCTEETWDRVMEPNVKGMFFCCAAVGREMVKRGSGSIVNLSSQVGLNPGRNIGAYGISKAADIMLTRQLALELAEHGIRVNAIAPGTVRTEFTRGLWEDEATRQQASAGIPLGRLAEPEDIAWPAVFLASDEAGYMTGAVIQVDGGWQVPVAERVPATFGER
jgi:NAD(P)-dependent dehydrogenase (short-subunit alcohol dehydrogenase family)